MDTRKPIGHSLHMSCKDWCLPNVLHWLMKHENISVHTAKVEADTQGKEHLVHDGQMCSSGLCL